MSTHLHRDIDMLRQRLLRLGERVENSIREATDSFTERDAERAKKVIQGDVPIDAEEVRLEEECLKVLALHHPVAGDLRLVVAALKVNNDLERMGDAAANIGERALKFAEYGSHAVPVELQQMVVSARGMTRKALESLLQQDTSLARQVLAEDDAVDVALRRIFDVVIQGMRQDPASIEPHLLVLSVARQLERIADLATNIAEDVIFLEQGEIVRHRLARLQLLR
jgi:phosphate transport system protein